MGQQNSFGKALASTDKKVRDKAVKRLSKYLSNKKDLSDLDLLKLWKGLFSCLWICDKPLFRQQLSEKLASVILKIPDEIAIKFVETFWKEIRLEWTKINKLRLEKFYNIFRQIHFNSFKFLEKVNWDITHVIKYMNIYIDGPLSLLDKTVPPSLLYHVCEVFLPELDNAISKPIPQSVFIEILEPFFDVIGFCSNEKLVEKVIEELFTNIANIYENEDSNNREESNIIKSCNFKDIYERLKKLNDDPHVLKKNIENIENLIITFKNIFNSKEILNEKEEEDKDIKIIKEDENESEVKKANEIIIKEEKLKTKSKRKTTKKASKKAKNKTTKKEQIIEIVEDIDKKPTKKGSKKRKAEVEPIEINEENEEDNVEIIELPKKKRKILARSAKREANIKLKSKSKFSKDKINEEVIVITESDESDEENKLESKIAKNIKKNNKKSEKSKNSKISKDKDVNSESSLKSKNNSDKNIKYKKIKTFKTKEKNHPIETIIEIESDETNSISSPKTINTDLSYIKTPIASPSQKESIITIDETTTSKKSRTKLKSKVKKSLNNKKIPSSSIVIDIVETSPKIIESNKLIKNSTSTSKKKKKSKKEKNEKLTKEEEAFVNKILRESHLINDKAESISITTSSHPTTIEKIPEKITIESLMQTDSTIKQPKGHRGAKRSRASDFF